MIEIEINCPELAETLDKIIEHADENFVKLAEIANLNPSADFVGKDLRKIDLSGCVLAGWNFTRCDLRGMEYDDATDFTGAVVTGARFSRGVKVKGLGLG